MPAVTIHREESENDTSKPLPWALIPSPRSPRATTGDVDSRALVPYSAPSQQPLSDSSNNGQHSNPYIPQPDQGPFEHAPGPNTDNTPTGSTFYFATQIQVINVIAPVVAPYPCHCQFNQHGDDPGSPRIVVEEHELPETDAESSASRSSSPRSPRGPRSRKNPRKPHLSIATRAPRFFSWDSYIPTVLPKKRSPAMRASHEEVIDAFDGVEMAGPVSGLGRFAKPLINKYHTSGYASEFQGSGERVLLKPTAEDEPRTPTSTRRELERLECEMFDISKYRGNTNHLTVLTWASDSHWGSITLFKVQVEESSDWTPSRRRKRRSQGQAVAIRPIAAMEDVPKAILVNMRVDQDIRKIVLEYSSSEGKYRWRSQVPPGPSYARVVEKMFLDQRDDDTYSDGWTGEVQSPRGVRFKDASERAVSSSEEEDSKSPEGGSWDCESPSLKRGRRRERRYADGELERDSRGYDDVPDRRRRPQPSSLLRVEEVLIDDRGKRSGHRSGSSTSRSRSHRGGRVETGPDTGILATVPQFMALIHANRSILEGLTCHGGIETVEVDEDVNRRDRSVRCITIAEKPIGKRHAGRDVHVVVLMPNSSSWAEERILWTDEDGELTELRQKVFRDVIGRGRSCSRASSRGSSGSEGNKSPRKRESKSADGRGPQRRTGGRRFRRNDERSPSPPKSARW